MADDKNRWTGRPWMAIALRVLILAVPLLIGLGVSELGIRLLRVQIARDRWWLVLVLATSVAVSIGTERLTRRLLPLSTLLKLSMLFPDRAPSRFKVARGAAGAHRTLARHAADNPTHSVSEVAEALLALITSLGLHDRRTRGHSERVCVYVELLADQLRIPREDRDRLRWAALLHDIGKLRVAATILNKPAKLSDSEWALVAEHPASGEEILGPLMDWLGEWGSAVRHHHERFDGSGYPDRIGGNEIPRAGRIVAIADSFEVMTAHRAYKKPMATVAARAELARCAGSQFDPAYVRSFLGISLPRLLWAMGPGALAMNLPMLRVLVSATPRALAAIPQGAAVAVVAGGLTASLGSGQVQAVNRTVASAPPPVIAASAPLVPIAAEPVAPAAAAPSDAAGPVTRVAPAAAPRRAAANAAATSTTSNGGLLDGVTTVVSQVVAAVASLPVVSWLNLPAVVSAVSSVQLSVLVSDTTASLRCALDGGGASPCSSTMALTGLSDGTHTVTVSAVDANGAVSAPLQTTFVVAAAAPSLLGGLLRTWNAVTGLTYQYSTDGVHWLPTTSPNTLSLLGLLTGQTFFLRGTDARGNHTNITSGIVGLLH
jgi:hypothetical protein